MGVWPLANRVDVLTRPRLVVACWRAPMRSVLFDRPYGLLLQSVPERGVVQMTVLLRAHPHRRAARLQLQHRYALKACVSWSWSSCSGRSVAPHASHAVGGACIVRRCRVSARCWLLHGLQMLMRPLRPCLSLWKLPQSLKSPHW